MLTKLKSLGPGLLYAGAAIGVSHLVQSTKAGATYGYILIIAIVLAHVFKYPFFALGPRYANKTGESLVAGYAKMGRWAVVLLLVLTLSTMFTVQAAVTIVTAGLLQHMGVSLSAVVLSLLLLVICLLILRIGNYSILDNLMKVIMIILSVSTLAAFALSFSVERGVIPSAQTIFTLTKEEDLGFLLAFVGWMPAPLDIAIWHSIWTLAKGKSADNGEFDFRVGFYGTAILGIFFLVLGANTMYGSGEALESSAGGFAAQLITSFTSCLGTWSYWFITIAAFTTMFSTTLTTLDASPRSMHKTTELVFEKSFKNGYLIWSLILISGTLSIYFFFLSDMGTLIKTATVLSFLTAPFYAVVNYILISSKHTPKEWRPSKTLHIMSCFGILFLIGFSVWYLIIL